MKRKFVNLVLAFALATLTFLALCMLTGSDFIDAFMRVTDGWIFGVLFMASFDAIKKAIDKEKFTKTYIATIVMILLNVVLFFLASSATSARTAVVELSLSLVFGGCAIIVPVVINRLKGSGTDDTADSVLKDEDTIQTEWVKLRAKLSKMTAEKKKTALEANLSFKLVGDSIYNALDIARPLIEVNGLACSVNYAKNLGTVDATVIADAETYIATILA